MKKAQNAVYFWLIFVFVCLIALFLIMRMRPSSRVGTDDLQINMVSGTEYAPGQNGQIIAELRNRSFDPIIADCNVTVLYHNKTVFINNEPLLSDVMGTYYYNFTVPGSEGVYEYSVICVKNAKKYAVGKSFHVSGEGLKIWLTP